MLAQKRWKQHDQYGINVALCGQWKSLDQTWNYGADLPPSSPRIVHYVGNGKPGLPTCNPFFSRLFLETLNRTPYRGSALPVRAE
jgi:hypothetical protein